MALVRVWTGRPRPASEAGLGVGGEQFEPLPDPPGVDASAWRGGFPIPTALLDAAGGSVQLVVDGRRFDVAPPVDPRVAALEAAVEAARADSRATLLQLDAERRRARDAESALRASAAARETELARAAELQLEARDSKVAGLEREVADLRGAVEARERELGVVREDRDAEAEALQREAAELRAGL